MQIIPIKRPSDNTKRRKRKRVSIGIGVTVHMGKPWSMRIIGNKSDLVKDAGLDGGSFA